MTLFNSYHALVNSNTITVDPAQNLALEKLNELSLQLNKSGFGKMNFFRRLSRVAQTQSRGLYIWGDVGRGKTMLMDLFFASVETPKKLRIHFHAFMQDVHAKRVTLISNDVISDIADDIAKRAILLCLDEMQISDIADAMIIGRLFEALQKRGVVLVTTANLPPDQLYKDGLNRHLFLPFIEKLNTSLDVVHLASGKDYRLGRLASRKTYLTPLGKKTDAEIQAIWDNLTDGDIGTAQELKFLGRTLHVPKAARDCARFTFEELCERPRAAPDYLALAHHFHNIFIEQIPILKASQRNEAKRFILMIDSFYDCKTHLIISAEAESSKLCTSGPHRVEFQRTDSRLQEMQSAIWWKS
jgi:cell division protein ZapE